MRGGKCGSGKLQCAYRAHERWPGRWPALRKTLRAAVYVAGLSGLSACASTSNVSDNLSLGELQKSNSAVAIMMMGGRKGNCPAAEIGLGHKVEGGYKQVNTLLIRNNWLEKGAVPQVELAPGSYHVISWSCANGRFVQTVGRKKKQFLSWSTTYLKSYASFTLSAGEVVNLGLLRMTQLPGLGLVRFDVEDLPPRAHEQLRKERPKLYAQMTTRLMKVEKKPLSASQRKAFCNMAQALASAMKKQDLTPNDDLIPKECRG